MKNRFGLLLVVAVFATVTGVVGATGQAEGTGDEIPPATIQLWHDVPAWQESFEAMAEKAQTETDVMIEVTAYPSTDAYQTAVRSALVSAAAPEMFKWWSGYRMEDIARTGLLLDVTELYSKRTGEYTSGLQNAFTYNGRTHGIPLNLNYWAMWYNKDVFDEYGLTPPQTWDEFIENNDILLENGITPMGHTVSGRWPSFIWFEELMIQTDPDAYEQLMSNEISYDSEVVREVFATWADMIERDYFSDPGLDMATEIPQLFANGRIAMVNIGNFFVPQLAGTDSADNIGSFIVPPVRSEAGNNVIINVAPILLSDRANNTEAALRVADWWMEPETVSTWAELRGFVPSNLKSDTSSLIPPIQNIVGTVQSEDYRTVNRFWEATLVPIAEGGVDEFARFMLNPDEIDLVIRNLTRIAEEAWSERE